MDFLFTWKHLDGSIVTFGPDGWRSSDQEREAWLNAMSSLTSSMPAAPPLVRIWLAEECQLVEVHRPDLSASIPKASPRRWIFVIRRISSKRYHESAYPLAFCADPREPGRFKIQVCSQHQLKRHRGASHAGTPDAKPGLPRLNFSSRLGCDALLSPQNQ